MTFEEWKNARHMNGIYWGDLKAAWDFAMLEEREACAELVWSLSLDGLTGRELADAIRRRSNMSSTPE